MTLDINIEHEVVTFRLGGTVIKMMELKEFGSWLEMLEVMRKDTGHRGVSLPGCYL